MGWTMTEPVDWSLASFEGHRRAQHAAFRALSFREKLIRLEQMSEVARLMRAPRPAGEPGKVDSGRKKTR